MYDVTTVATLYTAIVCYHLISAGKEWQGFAMRHSQEWADTYQGFLEAGVPLLILNYDEMEDPNQLRSQLLKICSFLHVPIKSSVFECVVARSQEFDLKVRNFSVQKESSTNNLWDREIISNFRKVKNSVRMFAPRNENEIFLH